MRGLTGRVYNLYIFIGDFNVIFYFREELNRMMVAKGLPLKKSSPEHDEV